jgi:hypothetical protein
VKYTFGQFDQPQHPSTKNKDQNVFISLFLQMKNFPRKNLSGNNKVFQLRNSSGFESGSVFQNIPQNSYDKNYGEGIQLQKYGMITLGICYLFEKVVLKNLSGNNKVFQLRNSSGFESGGVFQNIQQNSYDENYDKHR